jgi:rhodanese-related sulfurtransferase
MTTITTTASTLPPLPAAGGDAAPQAVSAWLRAGRCVLVDVREPDEFAKERIPGAQLLPLSRFDPRQIAIPSGQALVLHCRSGRRSADAAGRCADLVRAGTSVLNLTGGIEAWKAAGLPTERPAQSTPRLSVLQQTQLTIGTCVLLGLALGFFVHPAGLLLSAFMGCGLLLAGFTGLCPLAQLIAWLPWNRTAPAGTACECTGGTCGGPARSDGH